MLLLMLCCCRQKTGMSAVAPLLSVCGPGSSGGASVHVLA